MLTYILGILGAVCFACCGVPAAIATVKKGSSIGTPMSIAWAITMGSIFMYSYLYRSYGFDWLLTLNYGVEFISWATIVYYHYSPSRFKKELENRLILKQ